MSDRIRAKSCTGNAAMLDLSSANAEGCVFGIVNSQQFAHVYMPIQIYRRSFPPKEALVKGTLFPELWGVYPIPE